MATSDSDDFESADEELASPLKTPKKPRNNWQSPSSTIGSDSDDDNECIPPLNAANSTIWNSGNRSVQTSGQERRTRPSVVDPLAKNEISRSESMEITPQDKDSAMEVSQEKNIPSEVSEDKNTPSRISTLATLTPPEVSQEKDTSPEVSKETEDTKVEKDCAKDPKSGDDASDKESMEEKSVANKRERRQRKPREAKITGAKKLGAKVSTNVPPRPPIEAKSLQEIRKKALAEGKEPPEIEECWEFDEEETAKILHGLSDVSKVKMPEELRSEKKFKEIFKTDGWEGLDDETILSELEDSRVGSVLDKISEAQNNASWGSWGSWGSSLINSATAGVTTLTSHVTHGLTLLDEAIGAPNPEELVKNDAIKDADAIDNKSSSNEEIQPQPSFGFNDLLSGVSSITKLVETTGTKVITGGLGTLETIGKKTMEVLQEGDPGLKKKRAFFLNDADKPILSQMLREAKEKADVEEKTLEEKEMSRKVHFESLFDDYQGLVHLEALEMLSKQCNMKIQQRLVSLESEEFSSIQETLEEVKELCDLGDDEEDEDETDDNLQERLNTACKDLGVAITYEKINDIWKDTRTYITEISSKETIIVEREVFQRAISTLARFTAFSVERFHKTAELLLIKERRSTVNEADALVQLTRILSGQISIAANLFSNWLNERMKKIEKTDNKIDITTIFLEAANASSYIQDAFRLLIPILQVGAI